MSEAVALVRKETVEELLARKAECEKHRKIFLEENDTELAEINAELQAQLAALQAAVTGSAAPAKRRGRPPAAAKAQAAEQPKRRGRPPGSKNKAA